MLGLLLAAAVHAGPPISADLAIEPVADGAAAGATEIRFVLQAEPDPLSLHVGYDGPLVGPLTREEYERARDHVAAWLAERQILHVDGEAVRPDLRRFVLPEDDGETDGFLMTEIELAVRRPEPPRSVSVTCDTYAGAVYEGMTYIPVLVRTADDVELVSLYPAEPQFVWHAPPDARGLATHRRRDVRTLAGAERRSRVPAVSVAVVLATGGLLVVRRRLGLVGPRAVALASAGATAAVLLRGHGLVEVPTPWASRAAVPDPSQALAIFDTLHGNVYEAFAAKSEDEIYDLLAASVAPELLDEIYGEVYESLVLRAEAGAVCEVREVETLSSEVDVSEAGGSAARYSVEHAWRVHGLVAHWGHVHRRVNEYRATYGVRHDGESWKIAAVTVHDHRREDPDAAASGG